MEVQTSAPQGADVSNAAPPPVVDDRAAELALLRAEEAPAAEGGEANEPKGGEQPAAKPEEPAKPKGNEPGVDRAPEPADWVAFRAEKRAVSRRAEEVQARETALAERERTIAEREAAAAGILDDPHAMLTSLAKKRGGDFNKALEAVVSELNEKLAKHGQPEDRVAKLEKRLDEDAKSKAEREAKEAEERLATGRATAMREFVALVDKAGEKYPELARLTPEALARETADFVWGEGAAERFAAYRKEVGRDPTNEEIASALDIRIKGRYRSPVSTNGAHVPDRATGPVETANREAGNGNGGSAKRPPPAVTSDLAAARPSSPGERSAEQQREFELAALRGG